MIYKIVIYCYYLYFLAYLILSMTNIAIIIKASSFYDSKIFAVNYSNNSNKLTSTFFKILKKRNLVFLYATKKKEGSQKAIIIR